MNLHGRAPSQTIQQKYSCSKAWNHNKSLILGNCVSTSTNKKVLFGSKKQSSASYETENLFCSRMCKRIITRKSFCALHWHYRLYYNLSSILFFIILLMFIINNQSFSFPERQNLTSFTFQLGYNGKCVGDAWQCPLRDLYQEQ
jgi:hypothetical protein